MAKPKKNLPPTRVSESSIYLGHHARAVDNARVILPPEWRPEGAPEIFMAVFWPVAKPECLLLVPEARWEAWLANVRNLPLGNQQAGILERHLTNCSSRRAMDSYGRLPLPEHAGTKLGLQTEAMLAGRMDKFEIWEPKQYEAVMAGPDFEVIAKALDSIRI